MGSDRSAVPADLGGQQTPAKEGPLHLDEPLHVGLQVDNGHPLHDDVDDPPLQGLPLEPRGLAEALARPFLLELLSDDRGKGGGASPQPQGHAGLSLAELPTFRPRYCHPPHLAGRMPWAVDAGWSPKKWLALRFHWCTMLETDRAPDSASDDVVLADTSAPESSMGDFSPTRPATRSDMGFARRLSADTWGTRKEGPIRRVSQNPQSAQIRGGGRQAGTA